MGFDLIVMLEKRAMWETRRDATQSIQNVSPMGGMFCHGPHVVAESLWKLTKCSALQQAQPFSQPLVDAMYWFEATGGPTICSRVLDLGHERPTFTALQFIFVEGKTSTSFPSVL